MARKAAHDQRSTPQTFVCTMCQEGTCNKCIDIMRVAVLGLPVICYCKRKNHSGEPRDKQIVDPETGTVYGPGLRVTLEGDVLHGGYDNTDGRDPEHG